MIQSLFILGGLAYAGYKAYKEKRATNSAPFKSSEITSAHKTPEQFHEPLPTEDKSLSIEGLPVRKKTQVIRLTDSEINHSMKVASTALGFSVVGVLTHSPLSLLSVPLLMYVAQPIYQDAFASVMEGNIKSSTVDSIAAVGALLTNYYVAASLASLLYFWGNKLLLKTEDRSKKELINIFGEQPKSVWLVKEDMEVEIPFEELRIGDLIVIQAGEMIPIDGTVVKGFASVDQHILTGEAQPVEREEGDIVLAGTMVNSGKIFVRVDHSAQETTAAKIALILQNTTDFKSSVEAKSTQLSDMMALPSLILGGVTWIMLGPVSAITIISCNFMLNARMISPLGVLNFLRLASEQGILVKDGRCLELLHEVDTVVFDKTGTLTSEELHIEKVYVLDGLSADTIMQYAATAEHKQTHPVAKAITKYAKDCQLDLLSIENAQYDVGSGIKVQIESDVIHVGSERFMESDEIAETDTERVREIQSHCQQNGYALVYVAVNNKLVGAIELHVTIRQEAKAVIKYLKSKRLATYIISGDHESPTRKLVQELGVDHYHSGILPQDKARIIQELQAQGRTICFIGDGINDTVALKTSNASVSINGASTAAIDTAGIVLMDGTLNHLPALFELAEEMDKNMRNGFGTVLIPGSIGVAGVLFFHFKIYSSIVLYLMSLGSGTLNAMLPVFKHREDQSIKLIDNPRDL